MSEDRAEYDRETTRRQFLAGSAAAGIAAVSGCMKEPPELEYSLITETNNLEFTEFKTYKPPIPIFSDGLSVEVSVSGFEAANGMVWLLPDGHDTTGRKLTRGTDQLSLYKTLVNPERVLGVNTFVFVKDGDLDCAGDECDISGGQTVGEVKFEVSGDV